VAGDYVGSSSSAVGIRLFYADAVEPDVLFVASCPSGLIATVNTGLKAFAADTDKGVVVLSTPASQTEAQIKDFIESLGYERAGAGPTCSELLKEGRIKRPERALYSL
jgi:hypothetical protein